MEGFPHMDTESCNDEYNDFAVRLPFFDLLYTLVLFLVPNLGPTKKKNKRLTQVKRIKSFEFNA